MSLTKQQVITLSLICVSLFSLSQLQVRQVGQHNLGEKNHIAIMLSYIVI